MYSNEEKAIILANQASKLGIITIIAFLIFPVSWICCIDGYYKAKKAKTLAPGNSIVESAWKLANTMRWVCIIFLICITALGGIVGAIGALSS